MFGVNHGVKSFHNSDFGIQKRHSSSRRPQSHKAEWLETECWRFDNRSDLAIWTLEWNGTAFSHQRNHPDPPLPVWKLETEPSVPQSICQRSSKERNKFATNIFITERKWAQMVCFVGGGGWHGGGYVGDWRQGGRRPNGQINQWQRALLKRVSVKNRLTMYSKLREVEAGVGAVAELGGLIGHLALDTWLARSTWVHPKQADYVSSIPCLLHEGQPSDTCIQL